MNRRFSLLAASCAAIVLFLGLSTTLTFAAGAYPYSSVAACRDGTAAESMLRPGGYCALTSYGTPRIDPKATTPNSVFTRDNVAYIRFGESGKVRRLD